MNKMATKFISSLNNVQQTTLSDETTFQNLQSAKAELRRLATFRSTNNNIHPTLTKGLLAKNGFYRTGTDNKVQCEACGFEIESSISHTDLIEKHINQSPQCQFVLNRKDVIPANGMSLIFFID